MPSKITEAALWKGKPNKERVVEIQKTFFCDHDNRCRRGYGAMFTRNKGSLVLFYDFGRPPARLR